MAEDELHVGSIVHRMYHLSADKEDPEVWVCRAAIVTEISDRATGRVWLESFAPASQTKSTFAIHGLKNENWHFIHECPTGS